MNGDVKCFDCGRRLKGFADATVSGFPSPFFHRVGNAGHLLCPGCYAEHLFLDQTQRAVNAALASFEPRRGEPAPPARDDAQRGEGEQRP